MYVIIFFFYLAKIPQLSSTQVLAMKHILHYTI